jgi:hypothetical protein
MHTEPRISVEAAPHLRVTDAGEPANEPSYWVTRLRNGASAAVLYTRAELVELRGRIDAALLLS